MPVKLLPENIKAYRAYSLCSGQLITRGMNGDIVDISIPAVEIAMKWIGIPEKEQPAVGIRVLNLAREAIKKMKKEQDINRGTDA